MPKGETARIVAVVGEALVDAHVEGEVMGVFPGGGPSPVR
jgi:hypothetical protein